MTASFDALRMRFLELLRASEIAEHEAFLLPLLRPVFHIERVNGPPKPGGSKLGGLPNLPSDTPWPEHDHGPYELVAQIDFAELGVSGSGLPPDGLLSLYAATDPPEAYFWQDPGYVRMLYTPAGADVAPRPKPERSDAQRAAKEKSDAEWRAFEEEHGAQDLEPLPEVLEGGVAIRFTPSLDLPRSPDQRSDWPMDDRGAVYELLDFADELLFELCGIERNERDDHLLGYPAVSSLGYDPTPEGDWLHLLGLFSHEDLGWCWHDGDYLHVAIERARLDDADFSVLASDAG